MRRNAPVIALTLASVLIAPCVLGSGPPEETLRRANAAFQVLDGRGFAGSYLLSAHVVVSAPGEDGSEDSLEVQEVTFHADGTKETRLVRAVEDGRDVTAERSEHQKGQREHARHDGHTEIDVDLLPLGPNGGRYVFTSPRQRDGLLVAAFRPTSKARGVDGDDDEMLGRGEVAWDPATGDPVWIEVRPDDAPPFVSKLVIRFEFARAGRILYPRLVHTSTRAGIPLILKVKVDVDIEISDVRPRPETEAGAAVM